MSFTTLQIPKELVTPYTKVQYHGSIKIIRQIDSQSSTLLVKVFDKLLAYSIILKEWREIQVFRDGEVLDLTHCIRGFVDSRSDTLILFFITFSHDKDVLFFRLRDNKYQNYDDKVSAMFPTKVKDQAPFIFKSEVFFVLVYEDFTQKVNMMIVWHYSTGNCKKVKLNSLLSGINRNIDPKGIQGIS